MWGQPPSAVQSEAPQCVADAPAGGFVLRKTRVFASPLPAPGTEIYRKQKLSEGNTRDCSS